MQSKIVAFYCVFALAFLTSSSFARSCSATWECSGVSRDYNFVDCIGGQCVCKNNLGFSGSATPQNKCRCDGTVSWGNNTPYCKVCNEPSEIIYSDGIPHCVDPAACEAEATEKQLEEIRRNVVRTIYQYLVYPTPVAILSNQISIDHLFAEEARGRVTPLGTFDSFLSVEEYFYGLASTPTSRVEQVFIKTLLAEGNIVAVEVDILFISDVTHEYNNLTQTGFFLFDETNRVISTDLTILNLGYFYTTPESEQPAAIQQLCYFLTVDPHTCPPEADPDGYYESFEDCVQFMSSIPFGSWNRANSNSVVCRLLHSLLTIYRPDFHCPHSGKTGGGHCIDFTYESFYQTEY